MHLNIKTNTMAEINIKSNVSKKGSYSSKKHVLSTRVDLTPMVDLGFLLITFFIFTTSMSQPKAMSLFMPDDKGEPMNIKESAALTLIPSLNGMVYYYEGKLDATGFKETNIQAMRDLILDKKARTKQKDFFVVIKPADLSNYGDLVKVLDEMKINEVKRYSIADITKSEIAMMN